MLAAAVGGAALGQSSRRGAVHASHAAVKILLGHGHPAIRLDLRSEGLKEVDRAQYQIASTVRTGVQSVPGAIPTGA